MTLMMSALPMSDYVRAVLKTIANVNADGNNQATTLPFLTKRFELVVQL